MNDSRQAVDSALAEPPATAPSLLWSLLEAPRAVTEAGALLPSNRFLRNLPAGDGHPVLVLPGFLASDHSTGTLRRYIGGWGYDAHSWNLGRNIGVQKDGDLEQALDERLRQVHASTGEKVSLLGWSLGGLLAREMARRNAQRVRNVITLGSPLGDPKATTLWRLFELLAKVRVTDAQIRARTERLRQPLSGVPTTAIYSRYDAVVSWRISKLPRSENVENIGIVGSHLGMGYNPVVIFAIADRLRQRAGEWQPFDKSGLRRMFYY